MQLSMLWTYFGLLLHSMLQPSKTINTLVESSKYELRITFKVGIITFKCMYGISPKYLKGALNLYVQ